MTDRGDDASAANGRPDRNARARVVSFAHSKGGVGKTAAAVLLADAAAARMGRRVLIIDLDAQACASHALCGVERVARQAADERTLAAYFDRIAEHKRPERLSAYAAPAQRQVGAGALSVVCAEPSLRLAERGLIEQGLDRRRRSDALSARAVEGQTRRVLRDAVERVADRYDLIVIDSPPGVSLFAEAGLACSDLVVLPTIPDFVSTLGLPALARRFAEQMRRDGNLSGKVAILPTRARCGDETHCRFLQSIGDVTGRGGAPIKMFRPREELSAAAERALDPGDGALSFERRYGAAARAAEAAARDILAAAGMAEASAPSDGPGCDGFGRDGFGRYGVGRLLRGWRSRAA